MSRKYTYQAVSQFYTFLLLYMVEQWCSLVIFLFYQAVFYYVKIVQMYPHILIMFENKKGDNSGNIYIPLFAKNVLKKKFLKMHP